MRASVVSGASRGLGAALVDLLLARGDRVLGLARSFPDDLAALAGRHPGRLRLRSCDLGDPAQLPTVADLSSFVGEADELTLINNAATVEPLGAVGALPAQRLGMGVAVNLVAPMLLTNVLLAAVHDPATLDTQHGISVRAAIRRLTVVYVTSSVGSRPKPGNAAYGASKAGGEMFFSTLRAECAHDPRVTVHIVDPGGMDTQMHAAIRDSEGVYFPDRERLRQVAASGALASPMVVAQRLLGQLLFEQRVVLPVGPPAGAASTLDHDQVDHGGGAQSEAEPAHREPGP